jgi:hypothetical protein
VDTYASLLLERGLVRDAMDAQELAITAQPEGVWSPEMKEPLRRYRAAEHEEPSWK